MDDPPPYKSTATSPATSTSRNRSSFGRLRSMADQILRPRPGTHSGANPSGPSESEPASVSSLPPYESKVKQTESRRISDDQASRLSMLRSPASASQSVGSPDTGSTVLSAQDRKLRLDELKKEIEAASQQPSKRSNAGLFKEACSTDLLFLIDTTSSMKNEIDAAKQQVKDIMDDIHRTFLREAEVRMAVVGYRDHTDDPHIQFLDFTSDADSVRDFIAKLRAVGGDDTPEDVLGGLDRAINASWKNQTRCLIHIGDAPPHGNIFNETKVRDRWSKPGSEPHGLTYQPLLQRMIRLRINYCFIRIAALTDAMARLFKDEYAAVGARCSLYHPAKGKGASASTAGLSMEKKGSNIQGNGLCFEELPLGTSYSALRHLVVQSVTSSASRTAIRLTDSISRKGATLKAGADGTSLADRPMVIEEEDDDQDHINEKPSGGKKEEPAFVMEDAAPKWDSPGWFDETLVVEGFSPDVVRAGARTLSDMMMSDEFIELRTMELSVRRRALPFAQGALRVAAYARTAASTNRFVVKSFKRSGKHLAHLAEDMRCQALCKAFALEFNNIVGPKHALDFIVTTCLRAQSGAVHNGARKGKPADNNSNTSSTECMALEPYIEGEYVKYNNNSGYVNPDLTDPAAVATCDAAQAFSHFTYERSWGKILVCDLQGVGGLLTDPAIHTADTHRFRLADTNLNTEGFKFFFATHSCNDICRSLELVSTAGTLASSTPVFREKWPAVDHAVYCANKLCGRIVPAAGAHRADAFPGCHWCDACWPQLASTTVMRTCLAPGPDHDFEVSRFFFESQGRAPPRKCPEHRESDEPAPRPAAVGGAVWARMNSAAKQKNISGRSW